MRFSLSVTSLLAFVTAGAPALAAPVNVSTVAQLRAALADAEAGDEIILAAGTYAVSGGNLSCSANATPQNPIVVRSATPLAAKLELSTTEGFLVTGSSWHFVGLDVKGTCATDSACEHAFHVTAGATGFVLRGSRVVDFNAQLKVNAATGGSAIPHRGLVENCELFDSRARNTGNPVTKLNIDTGDDWVVRANYIHDFHRTSSSPTYGAFMKSGGRNGLFERNLVLCTKDETTAGVYIGLSFGGGGTGAAFCAPAFDANVPCATEHYSGTMRNNVIANCSDVGIYINRGANTKLLHNTLIATSGIDYRFATSSGEARGNVLSGVIRNREGSTHTAADNLSSVTLATFQAMYLAPLSGDLRRKGDLAALIGKGPMLADVPNDYCARTRSGTWDLGALQHALGDCVTVPPPGSASGAGGTGGGAGTAGTGGGGAGAGAGGNAGNAGSSSGGTAGSSAGSAGRATGGSSGSGGTVSGAGGGASGSAGTRGGSDDDDGGGCGIARGRNGMGAALGALIIAALLRRRRLG
ncbi:MAG TPA: right-handed parallel beta-helix repeat-containing protein [Polyangiaceae bacterium]|nr:right-handed parallel beta-helix repeat-containing protein [Polyangiaceae bacterium]